MDKQFYYIDPQGVRQGPLPLSSIPREHITPTTKVWCKGMDTWTDAIKVPDFAPFWQQPSPTTPQPLASSEPQPQAYQAPNSMSDESKKALYTSLIVIGGFLLIILIGVGIFFLSSKKIHHSDNYDAAPDSVAIDSTAADTAYSIDVGTTDYAAQEDYGYDDDSEEEVTLFGYMTDETGDNPIRLTFRRMGNNIYDCVYTNVALGGKIRMQGSYDGSHYTFSGKDGRNDFIIEVNEGSTSLTGYARDGSKHLDVALKYD